MSHRKPRAPRATGSPRGDVVGIALVVVAAAAYLSPVLKDGWSFGPYDLGSVVTIGHVIPTLTHNRLNGDLITQMIPWNALDWRLLHHGQLPLWNSYTLLGSPQMFNFESAVLSLPDLVGYLFPLSASFLVAVAVKLLLAGTGTYVFCRVLGARPAAAAFGGITFMLSGSFSNWLGWPLSDVVAWSGWICALCVLAYRSPKRRYVVLLAVAVAFAFYGGFPEAYALALYAIGAFLGVGGLAVLMRRRSVAPFGILRIGGGVAAGVALAAPLLLPGAQLLSISERGAAAAHDSTRAASALSLLVSQGYYGLPLRGSVWFGPGDYYETAAYIGIVALVVAIVGIATSWRRPAVAGVIGLTFVSLALAFHVGHFDPGAAVDNAVGLASVATTRSVVFLDFGIAVLAAIGMDRLLTHPTRLVRLAFAAASLAAAGLVAAIALNSGAEHLRGLEGTERFRSLIWPVASAAGVLVLAGVVLVAARRGEPWSRGRRTGLAGVLVVSQATFLIFAGVGLNSYSSRFLISNPPLVALKADVGSQVIGLDGAVSGTPRVWNLLGLYPNLNVAFSVAEFAGHDPLLPAGYFRSFPAPHGYLAVRSSVLVPDIDSVAEAQRYGIVWLLVAPGRPAPQGAVPVAKLGGEQLVRVPGASRFGFAGGSADGSVLGWRQTSDRSFTVRVAAARPSRLVLRLTDVPGWRVSADGRALPVQRYDQVMMSVLVPPGEHRLTISYWPSRFTDGLVIGLAGLVTLIGWASWTVARALVPRRRRQGAH